MAIFWVFSSFTPSEERGEGYLTLSSKYSLSVRAYKTNGINKKTDPPQKKQTYPLPSYRFCIWRVSKTPKGGGTEHKVSLPFRSADEECKVCTCAAMLAFCNHFQIFTSSLSVLAKTLFSSQNNFLMHVTVCLVKTQQILQNIQANLQKNWSLDIDQVCFDFPKSNGNKRAMTDEEKGWCCCSAACNQSMRWSQFE